MAVRIPAVLDEIGLRADRVSARAGMTARYYYARAQGHAAWGETDVQRIVSALHEIARELRAVCAQDLIEPGTALRPAGRKILRPAKSKPPAPVLSGRDGT